jgi:hypothetical protein
MIAGLSVPYDRPAAGEARRGGARSLGANTIMISFPVYTNSEVPSAGVATPPAAILATPIRAARAQGLQVGIRPLLDEKTLTYSRVGFLPKNTAQWLGAYASLLVPYARAAQQAGANRFWTGAELTRFAHDAHWAEVTSAVRCVFKGALYFSAIWATATDTKVLPGSGGPGAAARVAAGRRAGGSRRSNRTFNLSGF